jgi:glycosyltransferase involved in cell wall biosynthesis
VLKSASALSGHGFAVTVLGGWSDSELKRRDQELLVAVSFRFLPAFDFVENGVARFRARVRGRFARTARRLTGWETPWQLGYAYPALQNAARAQDAELFIAHSEQAMAVAVDLLQRGQRVGVDMEDWFSEDLLPEARAGRPIRLLRRLERDLLVRGAYAACPSKAIGEALSKEYGCKAPVVVYNAFPRTERQSFDGQFRDRRTRSRPSVHWFSQTLGPGRGLEDLLSACELVEHDFEIHLRGKPVPGFESWLAAKLPARRRDRLFVHGLVPNSELLSRIAEHDIGFAGEMKYCRSRELTITNKILYYLLAGLAVVASDTPGQSEVATQAPGAVSLYPGGNATLLAARLDALLGSPEQLRHAKSNAVQAAERTFCWERQEQTLIDAVSRAINAPTSNCSRVDGAIEHANV